MPTVLVTGYGGFLGREIVKQLLEAGFKVRGIARGDYPQLRALGVDCRRGDLRNRDTALEISQGCDAIIHTAAKAGVWGPWWEYYSANTLATSHMLEAAHRYHVTAFVYTSSPSVTFSGEPQSGVDESAAYPKKWLCFYPQTKALAERAVLDAASVGKVRTCALRPHLIWGNGDPHLFPRVVERALSGRLRRVGSGQNLIDVVHVESAARAHVAATQKLLGGDAHVNGQAMFLSDGSPLACWEWISQILECAQVNIPQKSISFAAAYRLGAMLEAAYGLLRIRQEPAMTRFVAAQLAMDHYFSIKKAQKLLGYAPEQVNRAVRLEECRPWLRSLAGH